MRRKNQIIFTYVIKLNSNIYYTGITKNLIKRIQQHHNKQSNYTSHFSLVSLNYVVSSNSYQEARDIEVKIKSIGARKYINKIKFNDRYYLDIPIKEIIAMSNKYNGLEQLKIIQNKRIHF